MMYSFIVFNPVQGFSQIFRFKADKMINSRISDTYIDKNNACGTGHFDICFFLDNSNHSLMKYGGCP